MTYEYHTQMKYQYAKWSNVSKTILDPVQKEMDKLFNEHKIDFSFNYKPIYSGYRVRENPREISFTIEREIGDKKTE